MAENSLDASPRTAIALSVTTFVLLAGAWYLALYVLLWKPPPDAHGDVGAGLATMFAFIALGIAMLLHGVALVIARIAKRSDAQLSLAKWAQMASVWGMVGIAVVFIWIMG